MSKIMKVMAYLALIFACCSAHAGIPVVDTINDTVNEILNTAQWGDQLIQLEQSYQQLTQQYSQLQQTYSAVTGPRGMAALLSNPLVQSNLPTEYVDVFQTIQNGGTYAGIRQALQTYTGTQLPAKLQINAVFDQLGVNKAALTDAYKQATQRLAQVAQLQSSIDSAQDPAAKQDLQNRMVSETQSIQANSYLLSMTQKQQEIDLDNARQTAHLAILCSEFPSANSSNTNCPSQ